jgi:predicted GNAT family N-acyltransferase
MNLNGYNRSLPASEQPLRIPQAFQDAMAVREDVFVKEQGCPLLLEADQDDSRSCHWIVYDRPPGESELIPAGTIRLVPYPHDPHPLPGSSWDFDFEAENAVMESKSVPFIIDRATTFHDGKEPYFKLGRWAVRKEFRGRGLASLLVRQALDWTKQNPDYFKPPSNLMASEHLDAYRTTWKGLVCIHAQEYVANAWAKLGFKPDEGMGKWFEAGILHVGMFQRLEVSK